MKIGGSYITSDRTVIFYRDIEEAIVGTVDGSGTDIQQRFWFCAVNYMSAVYDANAQKVVMAWQDRDNSNYEFSIWHVYI